MWALTKDDLTKARNRVSERRRAIEEEMKALDADLTELDAIERAIEAFFAKHQAASPGSVATPSTDQNANGRDPEVDQPTVLPSPQATLHTPSDAGSGNWGNLRLKSVIDMTRGKAY